MTTLTPFTGKLRCQWLLPRSPENGGRDVHRSAEDLRPPAPTGRFEFSPWPCCRVNRAHCHRLTLGSRPRFAGATEHSAGPALLLEVRKPSFPDGGWEAVQSLRKEPTCPGRFHRKHEPRLCRQPRAPCSELDGFGPRAVRIGQQRQSCVPRSSRHRRFDDLGSGQPWPVSASTSASTFQVTGGTGTFQGVTGTIVVVQLDPSSQTSNSDGNHHPAAAVRPCPSCRWPSFRRPTATYLERLLSHRRPSAVTDDCDRLERQSDSIYSREGCSVTRRVVTRLLTYPVFGRP